MDHAANLRFSGSRSEQKVGFSSDRTRSVAPKSPKLSKSTRSTVTRWGVQIFFIFTPTVPGEDSHFDYYFSKGLVQPPTRLKWKHLPTSNLMEKNNFIPTTTPSFSRPKVEICLLCLVFKWHLLPRVKSNEFMWAFWRTPWVVGKAEYFRGVGRHGISEDFWSSDTLKNSFARPSELGSFFLVKNLSTYSL